MGKLRKKIWWIATPALLAALLFQLYWLRQTYQSQQEAFVATATDAFNKAYDHAIILTAKAMGGDVSKDKKHYSVKASIDIDDIAPDSASSDSGLATVPLNSMVKLQHDTGNKNIRLDTSVANATAAGEDFPLAHFVSSIFSSFTNVLPDKDSLQTYYRDELNKKHITLPFTITMDPKQIDTVDNKPTLLINPAINNPAKLIGVHFTGLSFYLLKKMSSAIILSIFIALLITGCIWTLWRIILRQEKLDSMKREFISHVTHELKTPVAILQATNEALLSFRGMNDAEKTERYLRHSKTELDKLQDLIDKIMQVTRQEEEQQALYRTAVPVENIVNEVGRRFAHLPGVIIRQEYEIQQREMYTDKDAFCTILSNLLDNAIKYNDKAQKEVRVSVKELSAAYNITVADNGNGIEKQHFPFLYDKFYRIVQGDRHDVKGYGLGLSHVKALLQQLDGSISVSSTPGKGTTFTFQLPKYEKDQAAAG